MITMIGDDNGAQPKAIVNEKNQLSDDKCRRIANENFLNGVLQSIASIKEKGFRLYTEKVGVMRIFSLK